MIKVSDAIREIIEKSAFLRFGFHYQLLNLTQLAKFIQTLVEARIKKDITPGAIVMSLSRLGKEYSNSDKGVDFFKIHNLVVHTDLIIVTVFKTTEFHKEVNSLYSKIQKKGGIITVTEGLTEITLIFESKYEDLAEKIIKSGTGSTTGAHRKSAAKTVNRHVGSLSVKFDDTYLETPGFLYAVLRQIALQGINIIELSSTATEFILYMREKDIQLAFDTLYGTFSTRERHGLIPS